VAGEGRAGLARELAADQGRGRASATRAIPGRTEGEGGHQIGGRPPQAWLTDPLYFTVTVKHSLVRTVPSDPTTRKLTSNSAPSTNSGEAGGPRRTS
jgi:hypothetical protein